MGFLSIGMLICQALELKMNNTSLSWMLPNQPSLKEREGKKLVTMISTNSSKKPENSSCTVVELR